MTHVITHRGIDPSRAPYFAESSHEAFEDQRKRGYGLEFDPMLKGGSFIVAHDADLSRVTRSGCHIISLVDLLQLIEESEGGICALHLKHRLQEPQLLDKLLVELEVLDSAKYIIFDVKLDVARYLKDKNPALQLAPSVAHPYDIERYNGAVGETLYSVEEVLANRELFDWVLLDEWDTADKNGDQKHFYTAETFAAFKDVGLKIALVTPELHASSPGLLGGESHADAKDHQTLMARIKEILALGPDAVCTDFPDEVRAMTQNTKS